jgi:hypothetical protein
VRVLLSAGDLIFCAHHSKAYEAKLKQSALEWVDETSTLQTPVVEP